MARNGDGMTERNEAIREEARKWSDEKFADWDRMPAPSSASCFAEGMDHAAKLIETYLREEAKNLSQEQTLALTYAHERVARGDWLPTKQADD